jgi:hypothetical protein
LRRCWCTLNATTANRKSCHDGSKATFTGIGTGISRNARPLGATGKVLKNQLRNQFGDYYLTA